MLSYCCSSSDFLQSHCTVLLSSFLQPFSCTFWCCCLLPCISQILQIQIVSSSVLSFCRTDQEFLQWPRFFFFCWCLPRISMVVSVIAVLKVMIRSVSSLFMMLRGANFLPITAWKVSNTLGSFSFSRSTWVLCVLACLFFSGEGGMSLSASRDHFQCQLLENFVFLHCSLLIGNASSLQLINLFVVLSIWAMSGPSSGIFVMTKSVCQHKIVKGSKLQKSWVLSHLCHHCRKIHKCLASFHKHPCQLLHSSLLAQHECPSASDQWHSVAAHSHHGMTFGCTLVLLWCWKGLPSGRWWWACWRLGDISWQCSGCPCEQEIQCHATSV